MKHRFLQIPALAVPLACFLLLGAHSASAASQAWDIPDEIRRLHKEAPSIEAYPGTEGVVWLDYRGYRLTSDGIMEQTRRLLLLNGQYPQGEERSHIIPVPLAAGATAEVTQAAWYNPMTGMKEGNLEVSMESGEGYSNLRIVFPRETEGRVIAIETRNKNANRFYVDDAVFLSGELPIWEQNIVLEIPDGMDLHWQGTGLREPQRRKSQGREVVSWTLMNQPVWQGEGVVEARRPSLVFSLRKGIASSLKALTEETTQRIIAPPLPASVSSARGGLFKAGAAIADYMSEKNTVLPYREPQSLTVRNPIPDGGWTPWEKTLIAGRWFESLGFSADVYWLQAIPTPEDGPASTGIWMKPVLLVKSNGGEQTTQVLYDASSDAGFGQTPPSLYGSTLYSLKGSGMEMFKVPQGGPSDHSLSLNWKLAMEENGIATGSLEISLKGGWESVIDCFSDLPEEEISGALLRSFNVNAPGLVLSSPDFKPAAGGCKVGFDVRASLGIVSGNGILIRLPGVLPKGLEEIRGAGNKYPLRFPFVIEQTVNIATPREYRSIETRNMAKTGDSQAMFEESTIHWPKKRQLEAHARWTVRAVDVDEKLSGSILEQLNSYTRWAQATLPLRKK